MLVRKNFPWGYFYAAFLATLATLGFAVFCGSACSVFLNIWF